MLTPRLTAPVPATSEAPALATQAPVAEAAPRSYDVLLIATVLGLLCVGTIEIYASTAATSARSFGDGFYFLKRQLMWLGLGAAALYGGARFDYRNLRRLTYPMLVVALLLLVAVLFMPARNGAKRWLLMGPVSVQPVELAKLALISYLAYSLGKKADRVKTFTVGFVPHVVVCAVMMVLLLKQPDLGSSVVLGVTTFGMLFVAGTRMSYILLAMLAAAPIAYNMVVGTPWRMQRFLAYFNPEAFAKGEAYQFLQARLAMGSGGLTGRGLGESHQALGYMPEAHNDFILAPIGEELGWLGVGLVLALFAILVWRGVRAALGARDVYGGYLAFGITLMFGMQALFNAGVILGLVPNKGITLPLVSYGGSSLIVTMFLIGIILNVGHRPERRSAPREPGGARFATRRRQRVRVVVA
ncbi:MAG: putative lipid II flippase FtsW [Kofleriaceae bacterium]